MTVATQDVYEQFVASALQTTFLFGFHTLDSSHIMVYVDGTEAIAYTVTLNANQETSPGGSVVFAVGLTGGEVVSVERNTPQIQPMSYLYGDAFPSDSHETALDRLALGVQEAGKARNFARVVTGLPTANERQVGRLILLRTPGQADQLYVCMQTEVEDVYSWYPFPNPIVLDRPVVSHEPQDLAGQDWIAGTGAPGFTAALWADSGGGFTLRDSMTIPESGVWQFGDDTGTNDLLDILAGGFGTYTIYVAVYHPVAPAQVLYSAPVTVEYVD